MTWTEAFCGYVQRRKLTQLAVAHALGIAPSRVHAWFRGAIPRSVMRDRIAQWSDGEVPAALASAPESGVLPPDSDHAKTA